MAINDIESTLQPRTVLNDNITTNTTTNGSILDTADFELGLVFYLGTANFTDGSYELQLFESDDPAMAGAVQIVAPKILPTTNVANSITQSAAVPGGGILQKIGAFSNLRYVQPRVISTGVTTGALISVIAVQKGELSPVETA